MTNILGTEREIQSEKIRKLVIMAALVAIMFIMAFTPLGYLKIGALSITFMTIPVIIGAIILGPAGGAFLGGVFGLTSFMQCFGMDPFGAALLAINPVYTALLCFVPRILMGLLTAYIFIWLIKVDKTKVISFGATGLAGAFLNTLFFLPTMVLLFGSTDLIKGIQGSMNVMAFMISLVTTNSIIEMIVGAVVGGAIAKAVYEFESRRVRA